MVVQIVRFKSGLSEAELLRTSDDRAPRYREIPGLRQKLYLRFRETGEYGAVYLWENEEALARFRRSDLALTIPEAYRVQAAVNVAVAEVIYTLRPKTEDAEG